MFPSPPANGLEIEVNTKDLLAIRMYSIRKREIANAAWMD